MPSEYIVPASTVIAALLAFAGVVIVNKTRKPVATQDLWEENRKLRIEVREQGDRINLIEDKFEKRDQERQRTIGVLGSGFDALLHYLERIRPQWGTGDAMPPFSEAEHAAIDPARTIQNHS